MQATALREETLGTAHWRARPVQASLVRLVAFAIPFAAGWSVCAVFVQIVHRPITVAPWVWDALVIVLATSVAIIVDPLARRLLPLAALLQMSLLFPDRAPSRLAVAVRAGSAGDLQHRLHTDFSDYDTRDAAAHVLSLVADLSRHDRRTRGHSERVRGYARLMARELNLDPDDADRLQWAALLHDIGKLRVAPEILNKHGKLTDDEWAQIRTHPQAGADIIRPFAGWLGPWADAVAEHHERYDGRGYPHGIAGTDISLGARIVSVIDTYDVITAARSYKRATNSTKARAEIARCSGTQFDPVVVQAFLNISLGRLRFSAGPLAGLTQLPFVTAVAQPGFAVTAAASALPGYVPAAALVAMTGTVGMMAVPPMAPAAAPGVVAVTPASTVAPPLPATVFAALPGVLTFDNPIAATATASPSTPNLAPLTVPPAPAKPTATPSALARYFAAIHAAARATSAPTPTTVRSANVSATTITTAKAPLPPPAVDPAAHPPTSTTQPGPDQDTDTSDGNGDSKHNSAHGGGNQGHGGGGQGGGGQAAATNKGEMA